MMSREYMHALIRQHATTYDACRAVERLCLQRQGWQPISSAPKDGTPVLLGAPGRTTVGQWVAEQWPTAGEYHATTGEYLGQHETGECIEAHWSSWDGGFTEEHPPTHWMPLPAPPALSDLTGGGNG